MSILGKVSPTGTTDVLAYVCPIATKASLNISATNRTSADVKATISLSQGNDLAVSAITVVDPGAGFTTIPTLTVTGTGSGATAAAATLQVVTTTITHFSAGTGYLVGDIIKLTGGTYTVQAEYTVTAVDANGKITAANLTNPGTYTATFTMATNVTGGTGTSGFLSAFILKWGIKTVTVTNPGINFTSVPTVTPSAGTGMVFDVQMTRDAISAVDAIEYAVTIPASGVLERSGITVGENDAVFVKSSVADSTNFFVFGVTAIA